MGWDRITSAFAIGLLVVGFIVSMRLVKPGTEPLHLDGVERARDGFALRLTYLGARASRITPEDRSKLSIFRIYRCAEPAGAWDGIRFLAHVNILNRSGKGRSHPYGARFFVDDGFCMRDFVDSSAGYPVPGPPVDWSKMCVSYEGWTAFSLHPFVRATTAAGDLTPVGQLCDKTEPVRPPNSDAAPPAAQDAGG